MTSMPLPLPLPLLDIKTFIRNFDDYKSLYNTNPSNIECIALNSTFDGPEDIKVLSLWLINCKYLTVLIISNNRIGDAGCIDLIAFIQHNTYLTDLNLSENNISCVGAEALALVLQTNTSLKELNLDNNNIRDYGAKAISDCLLFNTSLDTLKLLFNNISTIGLNFLANSLLYNTTLSSLDIGANINYPRSESIREFARTLTTNKTLMELKITTLNNNNNNENCISIRNGLDRNKVLWENHFWTPLLHKSFTCHRIVLVSLVCNEYFSLRLPVSVWEYIFSFIKRKN